MPNGFGFAVVQVTEKKIMPYLQYRCPACEKRFEELVKSADEKVVCPVCGKECVRDYQGKVYAGGGKPSHCTHHCATCGGCK